MAGGKGREEKNGKMGKDVEEKEDVNFALSCKNFCGHPCSPTFLSEDLLRREDGLVSTVCR